MYICCVITYSSEQPLESDAGTPVCACIAGLQAVDNRSLAKRQYLAKKHPRPDTDALLHAYLHACQGKQVLPRYAGVHARTMTAPTLVQKTTVHSSSHCPIMSNTKRVAYDGPPLTGPGIIWTNCKIDAPDKVSPELFKKWYETVHITEIINAKPGGVVASSRYKCMDSEREAPYLAIYSLPDLGFLQTAEFKAVPMTNPMLPEGGPIHKFASFDTRFYQRVQVVERPGAPKGRAPILISAALDPADGTEEDFNEWYENEASFLMMRLTVSKLSRSTASAATAG